MPRSAWTSGKRDAICAQADTPCLCGEFELLEDLRNRYARENASGGGRIWPRSSRASSKSDCARHPTFALCRRADAPEHVGNIDIVFDDQNVLGLSHGNLTETTATGGHSAGFRMRQLPR